MKKDGVGGGSDLGLIPKGWSVKELGEVAEIITGKTPSTKKPENYGNKYPFITIPDMHKHVFITKSERYLSEKGNKVQENKLIPENSIQVSCIATVGLVSINIEPSHTNQQINSVVPFDKNALYFFYEYLKTMEDRLKAIGSTGSTTLNVNKGQFERIKYIIPSDTILEDYYIKVKSIYLKLLENQKQNNNLILIRDTILPKLMNGEIKI
jgi:type I restriction enzyme, S subunit